MVVWLESVFLSVNEDAILGVNEEVVVCLQVFIALVRY